MATWNSISAIKMSGTGRLWLWGYHQTGSAWNFYHQQQLSEPEHPNRKTTSIGIEISDPYVKTISKSKFKVTSSNSSVLKVQSITQDSKKRSRFTVTLKALKAGSAKITLSYPKATAYKLTGKVTSPSKTVATFRASKTTLKVGSKVSMRSLINLKGGTSLTIKNAKSSKPSVLAISGNYLVPKKKGSATVTANLNDVNRKITITVSAPAAKPTVKNLKISVAGIKYGPNDMKTYYTLKFTNTSAKPSPPQK